MVGIKFYSILLTFTFLSLGCAKPNYINSDTNKISAPKSEKTETCQIFFKSLNVCANLKWNILPTQNDSGSFSLHFYNNGVDFSLTKIPRVFLWMPSMGHGSSPVTIKSVSASNFNIEKVFFIMPGEWDINVIIQDEGGVTLDQASYSLTI